MLAGPFVARATVEGTLRKIVASMVALSFVALGCNSRLLRPPVTVFVDGGEARVATSIDEKTYRFGTVLHTYFPTDVPVHARDTVRFEFRLNGEPHTVALGTLVDDALNAVGRLSPTATTAQIEALPEMLKIPAVFPIRDARYPPRLNGPAADPCFLERDTPPLSATGGARVCPDADQPDFDGAQTFYSSGVIEKGESFRVKLAGDIEPASYGFMCLVHRAAMTGTMEVRAGDQERPRVSEVRKQASDALDQALGVLEPPARRAVVRKSGPVLAGTGPSGTTVGFVAAFIPETKAVRAGEPVTWRFFKGHTITFNPKSKAKDGIIVNEGGRNTINADAVRAEGPESARRMVAQDGPGSIEFQGGTWDGDGSFNSGLIRSAPGRPVTYTMRFTEPGAYRYQCLVHDRMRGRIVVS